MSIWTAEFWKATAERVLVTAAQAGLLALGYDIAQAVGEVNAFSFGWYRFAGFVLGGAVLSLLKCIIANGATRDGPSLTHAEVVVEQPEPQIYPDQGDEDDFGPPGPPKRPREDV